VGGASKSVIQQPVVVSAGVAVRRMPESQHGQLASASSTLLVGCPHAQVSKPAAQPPEPPRCLSDQLCFNPTQLNPAPAGRDHAPKLALAPAAGRTALVAAGRAALAAAGRAAAAAPPAAGAAAAEPPANQGSTDAAWSLPATAHGSAASAPGVLARDTTPPLLRPGPGAAPPVLPRALALPPPNAASNPKSAVGAKAEPLAKPPAAGTDLTAARAGAGAAAEDDEDEEDENASNESKPLAPVLPAVAVAAVPARLRALACDAAATSDPPRPRAPAKVKNKSRRTETIPRQGG